MPRKKNEGQIKMDSHSQFEHNDSLPKHDYAQEQRKNKDKVFGHDIKPFQHNEITAQQGSLGYNQSSVQAAQQDAIKHDEKNIIEENRNAQMEQQNQEQQRREKQQAIDYRKWAEERAREQKLYEENQNAHGQTAYTYDTADLPQNFDNNNEQKHNPFEHIANPFQHNNHENQVGTFGGTFEHGTTNAEESRKEAIKHDDDKEALFSHEKDNSASQSTNNTQPQADNTSRESQQSINYHQHWNNENPQYSETKQSDSNSAYTPSVHTAHQQAELTLSPQSQQNTLSSVSQAVDYKQVASMPTSQAPQIDYEEWKRQKARQEERNEQNADEQSAFTYDIDSAQNPTVDTETKKSYGHSQTPFQHDKVDAKESSFSHATSQTEDAPKEAFMHDKDTDAFMSEKPQSAQTTQVQEQAIPENAQQKAQQAVYHQQIREQETKENNTHTPQVQAAVGYEPSSSKQQQESPEQINFNKENAPFQYDDERANNSAFSYGKSKAASAQEEAFKHNNNTINENKAKKLLNTDLLLLLGQDNRSEDEKNSINETDASSKRTTPFNMETSSTRNTDADKSKKTTKTKTQQALYGTIVTKTDPEENDGNKETETPFMYAEQQESVQEVWQQQPEPEIGTSFKYAETEKPIEAVTPLKNPVSAFQNNRQAASAFRKSAKGAVQRDANNPVTSFFKKTKNQTSETAKSRKQKYKQPFLGEDAKLFGEGGVNYVRDELNKYEKVMNVTSNVIRGNDTAAESSRAMFNTTAAVAMAFANVKVPLMKKNRTQAEKEPEKKQKEGNEERDETATQNVEANEKEETIEKKQSDSPFYHAENEKSVNAVEPLKNPSNAFEDNRDGTSSFENAPVSQFKRENADTESSALDTKSKKKKRRQSEKKGAENKGSAETSKQHTTTHGRQNTANAFREKREGASSFEQTEKSAFKKNSGDVDSSNSEPKKRKKRRSNTSEASQLFNATYRKESFVAVKAKQFYHNTDSAAAAVFYTTFTREGREMMKAATKIKKDHNTINKALNTTLQELRQEREVVSGEKRAEIDRKIRKLRKAKIALAQIKKDALNKLGVKETKKSTSANDISSSKNKKPEIKPDKSAFSKKSKIAGAEKSTGLFAAKGTLALGTGKLAYQGASVTAQAGGNLVVDGFGALKNKFYESLDNGSTEGNISRLALQKSEMFFRRSGSLATGGAKAGFRYVRDTPMRKKKKAEIKGIKNNHKTDLKAAKNRAQKKALKKKYAAQLRESKGLGRFGYVGKFGKGVLNRINPFLAMKMKIKSGIAKVVILVKVMFTMLIVSLIPVALTMCVGVFGGDTGALAVGSYSAEPSDITAASVRMSRLEATLMVTVNNFLQSMSPDTPHRYYDVNIDPAGIGHNPFVLLAYLTARFDDFLFSSVQSEIQSLFDDMYEWIHVVTYSDCCSLPCYCPSGCESGHGYYTGTFITASLTAISLEEVIASRMTAEEAEHFETLMIANGARQIGMNPIRGTNWLSLIEYRYGYDMNENGVRFRYEGMNLDGAMLPVARPVIFPISGEVTFSQVLPPPTGSEYHGNAESGLTKEIYCSETDVRFRISGLVNSFPEFTGTTPVGANIHTSTTLFPVGTIVEQGEVFSMFNGTARIQMWVGGVRVNPLFFVDNSTIF